VSLRPNGVGHEKNCADAIRTFIVKLSEILDCSADELLGLRERNAVTGAGNRRMLRLLQQREDIRQALKLMSRDFQLNRYLRVSYKMCKWP